MGPDLMRVAGGLSSDPVFRAGCGQGLVCWARMAVVRGREVCLCGQLVSSERGQEWYQPRARPFKKKTAITLDPRRATLPLAGPSPRPTLAWACGGCHFLNKIN